MCTNLSNSVLARLFSSGVDSLSLLKMSEIEPGNTSAEVSGNMARMAQRRKALSPQSFII